MTRKEAREAAFMFIFEYGFNREKSVDEIVDEALEERGLMGDDYSKSVFQYVTENIEQIDKEIDRCIVGRSASRITKPGRAIMRLATAEIMMGDTPAAVAINEAVELAKKFDADEMPSYINGVLGTLVKNLGA